MVNKAKQSRNKVVTHHAAVIIYNYTDRLGSGEDKSIDDQAVDQIILNTTSLISVKTTKSKSSPIGNFEIHLAPTKNWISAITPGSWCIILMSQKPITYKDTKAATAKVNPDKFKMLGRISDVRLSSAVDLGTGTRETRYVITGVDWASIFNTVLYIDPLVREDDKVVISQAERLLYNDLVKRWTGKDKDGKVGKASIMSPAGLMQEIVGLWGRTNDYIAKLEAKARVVLKSDAILRLPKEVAKYMQFVDQTNKVGVKVADTIRFKGGVLTDNNYYKETGYDGITTPQPSVLIGQHPLWSILTLFSNPVINELYNEITWNNGKPELTLIKRVRPFCIHDKDHIFKDKDAVSDGQGAFSTDIASNLVSPFKYVNTVVLDSVDIISHNAGTNWLDRFNFIELRYDKTFDPTQKQFDTIIKTKAQFHDRGSIQRDGFKPRFEASKFLPTKEGKAVVDVQSLAQYKYLLKEWYFDTHTMLNGVLVLVGQSEYIAVGDNIRFDANIIFPGSNFNDAHPKNSKTAYITAHIEEISNSVKLVNNVREFRTVIKFVRGILTNDQGVPMPTATAGRLDVDASQLTPSEERTRRSFATSTNNDPDKDKLRGR